jgi:hypothetical protein
MDRFNINWRRVGIFAGGLVLIFMVIDFNARLDELNRLNKQKEVVRALATQAAQTQVALQTQVAYAGSDLAVQDWARAEGHYIQPGDQPLVPVEQPGVPPIRSEQPTAVPTPMPNWQVWWELFFGER